MRQEGFYWVILGQNPPEIAYWERGEWWLAGDPKPWHPEAVTVVSDRLVFKPGWRRWHEAALAHRLDHQPKSVDRHRPLRGRGRRGGLHDLGGVRLMPAMRQEHCPPCPSPS